MNQAEEVDEGRHDDEGEAAGSLFQEGVFSQALSSVHLVFSVPYMFLEATREEVRDADRGR